MRPEVSEIRHINFLPGRVVSSVVSVHVSMVQLLNIREVSRDISVHMCAVCDREVSTVTFCLFNLVLIH